MDFAKPVKAISLPQDDPSTSDDRLIELEDQVQHLMEAYLGLTQPTQVNKITFLCDICSGPHDTQYCMENPEQAFVEYASSHTNEAGGLVSNFMASQDARLSKFEADFKQQQSKMTNKINTVLKAITDRIAGVLPSDTQQSNCRDNEAEEEEREREGSLEDTDVVAHNKEQRDTPQLELKDIISFDNLRPNRDDEGIEWLDVEEALDLVDTIFGRPFVEISCLAINRKYGLMTFTDGTKEITFKMPYKDPERSELSSEGHDLLSSRIILSEDDYDRGCRKPSDLEDGFYRDTIKLGPEYVTGMDDEGEVAFSKKTKRKICSEPGDGVRINPDSVVIFDEKKLGKVVEELLEEEMLVSSSNHWLMVMWMMLVIWESMEDDELSVMEALWMPMVDDSEINMDDEMVVNI
ncbi:hypothetical protein Tco_0657144 [Tanacetum coccineum]|uniref:MAK10-like protein n=1 Tax=Tanacetum coccineum TaxID=301880 RepID=A0ABQ4XBG4_9ASTR